MHKFEIIQKIDKTLDQLICNAEAISNADFNELSDMELEAFKKTQESLLQHLVSMDSQLKEKKLDQRSAIVKIQNKRSKFDDLDREYKKLISEKKSCCSILSKRPRKKILLPNLKNSFLQVDR